MVEDDDYEGPPALDDPSSVLEEESEDGWPERLAESYVRCRRSEETGRYGASNYRLGKKWRYEDLGPEERSASGIWDKIAGVIDRGGYTSPEQFMEDRFAVLGADPIPFPNQLLTWGDLKDVELAKTLRTSVEIDSRIRTEFATQRDTASSWAAYFEGHMSRRAALIEVITSTELSLSPLFRYCLAKQAKFKDLASSYYRAATAEFLKHPDLYMKHWGSSLPKAITRKAERTSSR